MSASLNQPYTQLIDGEEILAQSINRIVSRYNTNTPLTTRIFSDGTEYIRVTVSDPAYIAVGQFPYARKSSGSIYLTPDTPVYIRVKPGWKFSVIGEATSNFFYVLELKDVSDLANSLHNAMYIMLLSNGTVQKIMVSDIIDPFVTDFAILTEKMELITSQGDSVIFTEKAAL